MISDLLKETLVLSSLPGHHEWLAVLGRAHVIIIHFPIALLLMAALGEVCGRIRGRPVGWTTGTLILGALGAMFSMGLGWMLVWFSGYAPSATLTLHQYLGTGTALMAMVSAAVHWKIARLQARWWTTGLILITGAMVGLTGHLGGTLVHGSLLGP